MVNRVLHFFRPRCLGFRGFLLSAGVVAAVATTATLAAQGTEPGGPLQLVSSTYCEDECCEEEEDERKCYGPCCCQERGTLLQWSYGTSFSGGPDLEEPLVTDRPDFTESSVTVGRGVAQLEAGYTYLYDTEAGTSVKTHSYPEMLWRIGMLAEWFELRIGWNYLEETTTVAGAPMSVRGSDDLLVGGKFALTPQECLLPEMALIVQMTVPSGTTGISAEEVLPGVNWLYSWEVNDYLSIAGSSQGFRSVDDTGEFHFVFAQSMSAAVSLTETVGAYAEWFALFPSGAATAPTEHFFNGGFTYLVNNDIQLDVRAGTGLNSAATDYFAGTGFSVRF